MATTPKSVPAGSGSRPRLGRPGERPALVLLGLMIAAYALFFGWLSLREYWAYTMHALDMANMGQAAWNTVHGHPFRFSTMRLPYHGIEAWGTTTRLSFHVEFLFPLISLVYLIYPHPESLLVLQTAAIALGAVPVYLLSRGLLQSRLPALAFAAAYLLFPALQALNLYEFHPVSLAPPLLLGAFHFAFRRRPVPFAVCALAAMGTKEEIGLVVALIGLFAALVYGLRRMGIALALCGVAWSLFAVLVVEKHYRLPGTTTYFHSRYGYLGHGLHGVLNTVLHHPGVFAQVLFLWPKAAYLEHLLNPVGYLPLFALPVLILGAPTLALNLFSTDFHMYSALGDNSAELIAVMLIAGILGAALVIRLLERRLTRGGAIALVTVYLLAQALFSQVANGFTPIGSAFSLPSIGAHQRLTDHFVSLIPAGVPVSTQDQIAPHLSSRRWLYLFEDTGARTYPGAPDARYVLLDASAPTYPLPSDQLYDRAHSLLTHGWGITAADDGLILLEQGAKRHLPPAPFYRYLLAGASRPQHLLHGSVGTVRVLGWSRSESDRPNHPIPNLNYSIYLRPRRRPTFDFEPVIFELQGKTLMNCAYHPLGLDWLPASRWQPGSTYVVRLDPLETAWNIPGTARLYLGFAPMNAERNTATNCATLWHRHAAVQPVGALPLTF